MGSLARPLIATLRPTIHLERALQPLGAWLRSPDGGEIVANRPGEVWVERLGEPAMELHDVPAMDAAAIRFLAERVAGFSDQSVSEETPVSASFGYGSSNSTLPSRSVLSTRRWPVVAR